MQQHKTKSKKEAVALLHDFVAVDYELIKHNNQKIKLEFLVKEYKNVFTLGSVCDFPSHIMEGDIFNFSVLENYNQQCAVCLAYTPTPEKSLNIRLC